jgi:cbb3-type cytochrome c oxidase subunit III
MRQTYPQNSEVNMNRSHTGVKTAAFGLSIILSCVCLAYSANSITRSSSTPTTDDASTLFASECATCHGKDGKAKTFKAKLNHARNLTDAAWQAEVTDERLYNSIHNGKGKMPAFGKKLSDSQINALVAYVRTLKQ